jgi:nucleotide-binding universal stress UspA family protein
LWSRVLRQINADRRRIALSAPGSVREPDRRAKPLAAGLREAAQEILARTRAPFDAAGIPVTTDVEVGQPGQRLRALASQRGADLLVVGSRGHTELKALLLGSVSNQVVHGAPCPVLVVH